MAVTLTTQRNPLDPSSRESRRLSPALGATIADVLPGWARATGVEVKVLLNGQETRRLEQPLVDGDIVEVLEIPLGLIVPAVTIAASSAASAIAAQAATAAFFLGAAKLAGQFALTFLAGKLLAPNKGPSSPGDEASPTYRFGGITSNQDAEGAALPLVFGQIRTGGVVVQRYTRASLLSTYLYTLIAISEGPVEAIGDVTEDTDQPLRLSDGNLPAGMEINGRPVEDYEDVEVHVRMGNPYQDPVPGFEAASVQYEVQQSLDESSTPGLIQITPKNGGYDPGVTADQDELDKWDTAVSYSMGAGEEADEFVATITFPEGLYSFSSSGSLNPNSAQFQIRYQELDGSGTPIGNVVVLPAETAVSLAKAGAFDVEFRHPFIDPDTYVSPTAGYYLKLQNVNGYAKRTNPAGLTDPPPEKVQWSFLTWIRPDVNDPNANQTWHVGNFWDGTNNLGFKVYLVWDFDNPLRLTLFCQYGTGSGSGTASFVAESFAAPTFQNPSFLPVIEAWHHVAVTWDGSGGGVSGAGRLKLYWDGALLKSFKVENTAHKLPASGDFRIGAETDSTNFADADFDVTKLFLRELSAAEIQTQYNDGAGLTGTGSELDLLLCWPFDTGSTTSPDISPNGNTATLGGSASISTGTDFGVAEGGGGGTFKRGRYKIEIQRLDAEDTSTLGKNGADWSAVGLITWADFQYPGTALVGIRQRATDQLQGGAPTYTFEIKGRRVPIWDGASTSVPNAPIAWSQNPAWIAAGLLTMEEGLGDRYGLKDLKLAEFKEWADWCDEYVPDGLEQVDLADLSAATMNFSGGTATVTLTGYGSLPDKWKAGYYVRLEGVGDGWDSLDGEAYLLTSATYSSSLDRITLVWTWPADQDDPDVTSITPSVGLVRGAEPRMQCDIVLDRRNDEAVDVLSRVFSAGRAQRITEGGRVGVFVDKPASPACLVTHASVLEGSLQTTYVSIDERPNVIQAEILDRDAGYSVQRLELEHPDVQDPGSFNGRRVRSINLEGIVRRSQALREIKYQLNLFNLVRRQASWRLPALGIARRPGDVAMVAHDVPQWGFSGKLRGSSVQQALSLTASTERDVGMNVGFIQDYSVNSAIYRGNLFHGARPWISETASGPKNLTDNGAAKDLDENAMPRSLGADQRLATVLFRDVLTPSVDSGPLPIYKAGTYVVTWTGADATMEVSFDASGMTKVGARRYQFTVASPSTSGIHFAITAIGPGGIQDLRMFRGADEPFVDSDPWDPDFVSYMAPFKWVRWMEAQDINKFEGTAGIPPGYLFWTEQGPPPEAMADFSNRYGKGMWACCPVAYTQAEQGAFAVRCNNALAPELTLYLEYGNETWNAGIFTLDGGATWIKGSLFPNFYIFSLANDLQPTATPDVYTVGPGALDPNVYTAMFMQMGLSAEAFFTQVQNSLSLSPTYGRIVKVYGAQYANLSTVTVSVPLCPKCDAVAGAPYNPNVTTNINPAALTVDQIFTAMDAEKPTVESQIDAFVTAVDAEGKDVMWYEGGQQLYGGVGGAGVATMLLAQQDPRMKDQILWILGKVEEYAPGSKFTYYTDATAGGNEGQFGAKRYHAQPTDQAPKYQALLEWIGDTGGVDPGGGGPGAGETDYTLFFDRDLTIGSGTWYVLVQDQSTGQYATLTVQSAAGTYPAGAGIVARGTQGWIPAKGDEYSVGQIGKIYKQFRIVSATMKEAPLGVEVDAVEYNASVYSDDFGTLPLPETSLTVNQVLTATVPEAVQGLKATETTAQSEDGTTVLSVTLEWAYDPDTVQAVDRVEIYAQGVGDTPILRDTIQGQPTSYQLQLDETDKDNTVQVIVRPVGARGQARGVRSSAKVSAKPLGLVITPAAPTNVARSQTDFRAVYSVTHGAPTRVKSFEFRSGGWILGQRMGETGPSGTELGPIFHLGPFSDDADNNGPIPIYARALLGSRQYGKVASRTTFPTPPGTILFERWMHDQGATGWAGCTLFGFTRETAAAGTALIGDSANSPITIEFLTPQLREAQDVYFYVHWEAEQSYVGAETPTDTPLGNRWTSEGPLWTYEGETANASVRASVAYSTTSAAPGTASLGYRPGPVFMRQARVLLRFSRPSPSVTGIRVTRVYVAAIQAPPARVNQPSIEAFLPRSR